MNQSGHRSHKAHGGELSPATAAHAGVRTLLLAAGFAAAMLAGCTVGDDINNGPVALGEFKLTEPRQADARESAAQPVPTAMPGTASAAAGTPSATASTAPRGVPVASPASVGANLPTAAVAMEPLSRVSGDAKKVGEPLTIESLVGQINGKPVFAGEFLRPLDKRLSAEAAQARTAREWVAEATKLTRQQLTTQLQDELFLAEARASLSKEERAGLITLLTKLRENLTTTAEGSTELANERLLAEEGKTLEEKALDERDKILIRTLYQRYILPRVNVSWRDVQKDYQRNFEKYNPPPTATIRMIFVNRRDTAKAEAVAARLAKGESFVEIAKDKTVNEFNVVEAGLAGKRTFDPKSPDAKLVADPKINEKAITLSSGQFAGPIETGQRLAWVFMESIEPEPGKSLSEAQLEIASALREKRFRDETAKFYERLIDRGSKTDLQVMNERLMLIAADRYTSKIGSGRPTGTPAAPAAPAPAGTTTPPPPRQ